MSKVKIKALQIGFLIFSSDSIVAKEPQNEPSEKHGKTEQQITALEKRINKELPGGALRYGREAEQWGTREVQHALLFDIVREGNSVCSRGRITEKFLQDVIKNKDGQFRFDRIEHCHENKGSWPRIFVSDAERSAVREEIDNALRSAKGVLDGLHLLKTRHQTYWSRSNSEMTALLQEQNTERETIKKVAATMKEGCSKLWYRDLANKLVFENQVENMLKHGSAFHEQDRCVSETEKDMVSHAIHRF